MWQAFEREGEGNLGARPRLSGFSHAWNPLPFSFHLPCRLGNVEWQQRLNRLVYIQLRVAWVLGDLFFFSPSSIIKPDAQIKMKGALLYYWEMTHGVSKILTIFVNPEIKTAKSQFWVHVKLHTLLLTLLTQNTCFLVCLFVYYNLKLFSLASFKFLWE